MRTSVTMYESVPLANTRAPIPSTLTACAGAASAVSSALSIGSTRTSELVTSLPHQSDEISAMVAPAGCAVMTLRARVSSVTTDGAIGLV